MRRPWKVSRSSRQLDYLCLQPMREGQASYAHVNEIVTGLRARGWEVRLLQPPLPRPGATDGVRRAFAAAALQLRYWIGSRFRLARVVYIRTHFLSLPSAVIARVSGSLVVQEMNGPVEDGYDAWPVLRRLNPLISWMYRVQLRMADVVITVTPGLRDYVREFAGREGDDAVIGNGADVALFRPLDPDIRRDSVPYAVFVGALASWQGIDTVIAAAADPRWPANLRLVIAGDGRERDRVVDASKRMPHVEWRGTIPYADAALLVAGSSVALVPMNDLPRSSFGLSPLKLFEAMACGVPVVVSDLPGLSDIVHEHRCGTVFRAGDATALAGAISATVENPTAAQAMGDRGRAAALAQYSWDARAGQTAVAIERGLADRRRSRRRL